MPSSLTSSVYSTIPVKALLLKVPVRSNARNRIPHVDLLRPTVVVLYEIATVDTVDLLIPFCANFFGGKNCDKSGVINRVWLRLNSYIDRGNSCDIGRRCVSILVAVLANGRNVIGE